MGQLICFSNLFLCPCVYPSRLYVPDNDGREDVEFGGREWNKKSLSNFSCFNTFTIQFLAEKKHPSVQTHRLTYEQTDRQRHGEGKS